MTKCHIQGTFARMYKNTDSTPGTLKHLRNVTNRSAVGPEPAKNTNATEALMEDVLAAYVIRMALIILGLTVDEGYKEERDSHDVKRLAKEVADRLTCLAGEPPRDKVLQHTQVRK